ncbi:MAG TPA: glycosyltransferase [Actinomycetota bacterium]|nr:glycosyltransferase [Actinomycetota bacterium]
MRLNIGCGEFYAAGWINTDLTSNELVNPDVIASVLHLPFPDNSFDAVYMGHILEHLTKEVEVPKALAEVLRVLTPDGRFACIGPDIEKALVLRKRGLADEKLIETIVGGEGRWPGDEHQWLPTEATVKEAMKSAGFKKVRARRISSLEDTQWPVVSYVEWQHCVIGAKGRSGSAPSRRGGDGVARVALDRARQIKRSEGLYGVIRRLPRLLRWMPRLRSFARHLGSPDRDAQYAVWRQEHVLGERAREQLAQEMNSLKYRPLISVVMPVYNTDPDWLDAAIRSVRSQLYEWWELCAADDGSTRPETKQMLARWAEQDTRIKVTYLSENRGISAASNAALQMASGEFVALLDHDDELTPDALARVAMALEAHPHVDYIYTDEDKRDSSGRHVEPFFKPQWSPNLLLSMNYLTHLSVVRRATLDRVGGFRSEYDGSQDYDLLLRVTEVARHIVHIARPLYSWRKIAGSAAKSSHAKPYAYVAARAAIEDALVRRGIDGEVTHGPFRGSYRVRYTLARSPEVAILIPTRDRVQLLRKCIRSIRTRSTYKNYRIVIIDNGSREERTLQFLESFDGSVVRYPGPFNFSRMMNEAASQVRSEFLLSLNNDVEVVSAEWIEAMLEHGQRSEVGAVGARLRYPRGGMQHEGMVIGLYGAAGNVSCEGYFGLGEVVRDCSAVTGACMLTRSEVFRDVGGFDLSMPVAFSDVDYCLRLRELGYSVIYTPYALLVHREGASRGKITPSEDEAAFLRRWGTPALPADPFYNPNLDLSKPFSIDVFGRRRASSQPRVSSGG